MNDKSTMIFEFLNSINESGDNIMTPDNEKQYVPYLINHFLSGTIDTLYAANEMNMRPNMDKQLQYDYLRFSVRKKKRRTKWLKREKNDNFQIVQKYFKYSWSKTNEALKILTEQDIENIDKLMNTGGTTK
jgi:hypothetical protein